MTGPNLVIMGPPGAGKGTQAARIKERWGLAYVPSGDLLREHRASSTELGGRAAEFMRAGRPVPEELETAIILKRVEETESAFMVDGFPRSVPQAVALAASLEVQGRPLHAALLLDVADEVAFRRVTGRRFCSWGHPCHVHFSPPTFDGFCDVDGQRLHQRGDDRADAVRLRLGAYHAIGEPVVEFYAACGLLRRVDGAGDPAAVWEEIQTTLGPLSDCASSAEADGTPRPRAMAPGTRACNS